jgi:hypothetical protein
MSLRNEKLRSEDILENDLEVLKRLNDSWMSIRSKDGAKPQKTTEEGERVII